MADCSVAEQQCHQTNYSGKHHPGIFFQQAACRPNAAIASTYWDIWFFASLAPFLSSRHMFPRTCLSSSLDLAAPVL
jgi:hypothetical protein